MRPIAKKLFRMEIRKQTADNIKNQKRKDNNMNTFKYTDNASRFLSFIPSLDIELTAANCFKGILPWPGISVPDISKGVMRLGQEIDLIKDSIKEENKTLCKSLVGKSVVLPFNFTFDYLLENCTFYLATSEDMRCPLKDVYNIFTKQIEREVSIADPVTIDSIIQNEDILGLYLSGNGSIILIIDRIFRYVEANLLFQKVLLHELIHAILDIYPRVLNGTNSIVIRSNDKSLDDKEEEFDNTLVLYTYKEWSCGDENCFNFIKLFISHEPEPYSDAIQCYEEGYNKLSNYLIEHLLLKLKAVSHIVQDFNPNIINSAPIYWYSILEDGTREETPDELIPDNFRNELADICDIILNDYGCKVERKKYCEKHNFAHLEYEGSSEHKICITTLRQKERKDIGLTSLVDSGKYNTIIVSLNVKKNKIIFYFNSSLKLNKVYIQSKDVDFNFRPNIIDLLFNLVEILEPDTDINFINKNIYMPEKGTFVLENF